jgi:integrase
LIGRRTPTASRRKKRRHRAPGDRYDTHGYRRAIARACRKADAASTLFAFLLLLCCPSIACAVNLAAVAVPRWSPNRLRHSRATELRPYGLDVVKTVLGHSKVETTQIYSEKDLAAAMELMAKVG